MPTPPGMRTQETPCPECQQLVGVLTPPRVGNRGGPLRMKRSQHHNKQTRRRCPGSLVEVPPALIFPVGGYAA